MEEVLLADKYAKALISCAQEGNLVDRLDRELGMLEAALEQQADLREIFRSPLISLKEKEELLESTLKKQDVCLELKSFLFLLLKMRRFHLFGQICKIYKDLIYSLRKRLKVFVESASALDTKQKDVLKRRLGQIYQRNVDLFVRVNSALIGGARVYIGHALFDGTVATRLNLLRNQVESRE